MVTTAEADDMSRICPTCQQANAFNASFCSGCGARLPDLPSTSATDTTTALPGTVSPETPPKKAAKKAFGLPVRVWGCGLSSFFLLSFLAMVLTAIGSSTPKPEAERISSAPAVSRAKSEHDKLMEQPIQLGPTDKPFKFRVTYEVVVEEKQRFSVTYTNAEGGIEQDNQTTATEKYFTRKSDGVKVNKWIKSFEADPGASLHLSAQSQGEQTLMNVRIFVDNDKARESKAKGAFAIGSCDFTLPSISE